MRLDAVGKGAGMERKVIFHVDECGRFEMAAGKGAGSCFGRKVLK